MDIMLAQLLLKNCADSTAPGNKGQTARNNNHEETVLLFIQNGTDPSVLGTDWRTVLDIAIWQIPCMISMKTALYVRASHILFTLNRSATRELWNFASFAPISTGSIPY